nr:non-canonical purine NTP pyrophosphatase [Synergistales bacterium]
MGKAGFGYDPIFIPEGHKRTLGELGLEVKATLSHRSVAASALVDMLSSSSVIK